MSLPSTSRKYCVGIALFSVAVFAAAFLPLLQAKRAAPQPTHTDWTVSVILTPNDSDPNLDNPTYSFGSTAGTVSNNQNCPNATPPIGPHDLCVNQGDTIVWNVTTTHKDTHYIIYQGDQILADSHRKRVKRREADDGKSTDTATILAAPDSYEYCIAAYGKKHFYVDDPKIIVGGGPLEQGRLLDDIQASAEKLRKNNEQSKDEVDRLLKIVKSLREQLHLQ